MLHSERAVAGIDDDALVVQAIGIGGPRDRRWPGQGVVRDRLDCRDRRASGDGTQEVALFARLCGLALHAASRLAMARFAPRDGNDARSHHDG